MYKYNTIIKLITPSQTGIQCDKAGETNIATYIDKMVYMCVSVFKGVAYVHGCTPNVFNRCVKVI